ncbi:MAG TPA: hypothetical protein VMB02_10935 [Candidatus Aquilonibacter sp.]|nr:hypothetical protein [Candidatus Aquilonibacter sp.]
MSSPGPHRVPWASLGAIVLLLGAIAVLQGRIDAQTADFATEKEELLLSSPGAIQKLSLGYDALVADIYWTRAVQYYGSQVEKRSQDFHLLWPLLDVTTTLDPKFIVAYRFGAIFLSEPSAGANRTDLAVKLVKKGIAANPDNWHLDGDLGFLYYWRMKDYPDAANAYLEGSKKPGAPLWMKLMAARVAQMGGSIETSEMIWSELYNSTQDPNVRKKAAQELEALKAQDDEQHLDEVAADYHKRFGRYPASAEELRAAGMLPGIPVDPEGYSYVFGPDGKSALNPNSPIVIPGPPELPGASK